MPRRGYEEPPYYHMNPDMYREHTPEYYRDVDKENGRLYYTETGNMNNVSNQNMRDYREGRSGMSRRGYMESKEQHKSNSQEDKQKKMLELEKYVDDLSNDVKEMIMDSTPEEKSMLKQKLMGMANNL